MKQLNFDLKQLCKRNKDGSYTTQSNRERILTLIANQLDRLGYKNMRPTGIKPKHIEALVRQWKDESLSSGTIKNRMSALRWWAEKINRPSTIASDNSHYGIEERIFVTNVSKAQELDLQKLDAVADQHIRLSLRLQSAFGMRREESIKFKAATADYVDHIALSASWCKGGRAREIPIHTQSQRDLLNEIRQFSGKNSLIPTDLSYIKHLKIYEDAIAKAGLHKMHGLRHQYAQLHYHMLTGRLCPAAGGKTSKALTQDEKIRDNEARLIISKELGHEREQVTAIYLGR